MASAASDEQRLPIVNAVCKAFGADLDIEFSSDSASLLRESKHGISMPFRNMDSKPEFGIENVPCLLA